MAEDRLPAREHETQPTVLVSGKARALLRRVPLQLLAERIDPDDGIVVVTAREDPGVVARRLCETVPAVDPPRVAVVDATSKPSSALTRTDDLRWQVPSPVAFGHVRTAIDAALTELRARDVARVNLLYDALTTGFRLADADAVHQHAHDVAMTAGAERGLGLFTLAPSAVTDNEFERVRHLVDAHVAVRRTVSGPQVRWKGLVGESGGWVALADSAFAFDSARWSLG